MFASLRGINSAVTDNPAQSCLTTKAFDFLCLGRVWLKIRRSFRCLHMHRAPELWRQWRQARVFCLSLETGVNELLNQPPFLSWIALLTLLMVGFFSAAPTWVLKAFWNALQHQGRLRGACRYDTRRLWDQCPPGGAPKEQVMCPRASRMVLHAYVQAAKPSPALTSSSATVLRAQNLIHTDGQTPKCGCLHHLGLCEHAGTGYKDAPWSSSEGRREPRVIPAGKKTCR